MASPHDQMIVNAKYPFKKIFPIIFPFWKYEINTILTRNFFNTFITCILINLKKRYIKEINGIVNSLV